jgi:hypothetical protein
VTDDYGCGYDELKKEHRLKESQNRVLRRIFGLKID